MRDAFISYSSTDSAEAYAVRNFLQRSGCTCWMAPDDISAGSDYAEAIPKAIADCRTFVLILSPDAQNSNWVRKELGKALDRYDWYLVFPHFSIDKVTQEKAARLLGTIPPEKLIIMDRLIDGVPQTAGASYQSIEQDIPAMLEPVLDDIRKYGCLRYISLSVSLYGDLVAQTIRKFGDEHSVPVDILKEVPSAIREKDLFFVSGSRLDRRLSELIRNMSASGLAIGTDVGLICYNDFPLNEFILGGLTTLSTNFLQMGRTAAQMILSGKVSKVHSPCSLIRRNTF